MELRLVDGLIIAAVLGINVNLWWGLVMLVFGAAMAALGHTRGPSERGHKGDGT